MSFCIYILDAYYVTGTALGAGDIEVKGGAVNNFQQGMLWSTQEWHPIQTGGRGPGIGGVIGESFLKSAVSLLKSAGFLHEVMIMFYNWLWWWLPTSVTILKIIALYTLNG